MSLFLLKNSCERLVGRIFQGRQKQQELQELLLQLKEQRQRQQQALGMGAVLRVASVSILFTNLDMADRFLNQKLVDPTNSLSSLWALDELMRIWKKGRSVLGQEKNDIIKSPTEWRLLTKERRRAKRLEAQLSLTRSFASWYGRWRHTGYHWFLPILALIQHLQCFDVVTPIFHDVHIDFP